MSNTSFSRSAPPLKILILHSPIDASHRAERDLLGSFRSLSRHNISCACVTPELESASPLALFDAVIVRHASGLFGPRAGSESLGASLRAYRGLKVLWTDDDAAGSNRYWDIMSEAGINVAILSAAGARMARAATERLTDVEVVRVPETCKTPELDTGKPHRPLERRPLQVGFRGLSQPSPDGHWDNADSLIGHRIRAFCRVRNIPHDIEWRPDKQITADCWYEFLQCCRTVVGTSDGMIGPACARGSAYARDRRDSTEMRRRLTSCIVDAVASRTGLILLEGSHVGVLVPDEHYISMRQDFGNVTDVLRRTDDVAYVRELTARTYTHVACLLGYQNLVRQIDDIVERRISLHHPIGRSSEETVGDQGQVAQAGPYPGVVAGIHGGDRGSMETTERDRATQVSGAKRLWPRIMGRIKREAIALFDVASLGVSILGSSVLRRGLWRLIFGRGFSTWQVRRRLLNDLAHALALRRLRLADPESLRYEVVLHVRNGWQYHTIGFLSLPWTGRSVAHLASSADGAALKQALTSMALNELTWDHSAIAPSLVCPGTRAFRLLAQMNECGIYHFLAVRELARRDPDYVLNLLRWMLADSPRRIETRDTKNSSHSDQTTSEAA
jgi:hypothetical protein